MAPDNSGSPTCPACLSLDTKRLPFSREAPVSPVYACIDCGLVLRQPNPPRDRGATTAVPNGGGHKRRREGH